MLGEVGNVDHDEGVQHTIIQLSYCCMETVKGALIIGMPASNGTDFCLAQLPPLYLAVCGIMEFNFNKCSVNKSLAKLPPRQSSCAF